MKKRFLIAWLFAAMAAFALTGCDTGTNPDDEDSTNTDTNTEDNSPAAPTNVAASVVSESQIKITWTPVSGSTYYVVFRSNDDAWTNYVIVEAYTSYTTYTNTGLSANTTYYYKVAAREGIYSNNSYGHLSTSVHATTLSGSLSTVSVTALSTSSIRVSWTAVTSATGYKVYRSASYSGEYSVVSGASAVSGTSYDDTGLATNTTYYYKVSAIYADASESALSDYSSARTRVPAPTNVAATASGRIITLTWTPVVGATEYFIYCSLTGADGTFAYAGFTYSAAHIVAGIGYLTGVPLAASTTYYFKVSAYVNYTEGEMSSTVNATTGG
jgi:fibronectin type 3 domain-containing protein